VSVEIAGMQAELTATEDGSLNVKPTGNIVVGSSPILKWDQNAYMRQQLQTLGLKMQGANGDAETSAAGGVPDQGE
jgi:hypothetical protein